MVRYARANRKALEQDRLIDITTIGRYSGQGHRIEIGFHWIEGMIFISGLPGRRDWYANVRHNPQFTFHLKQSVETDISARAIRIESEHERRRILGVLGRRWDREVELDEFVARSPLIEVEFDRAEVRI